MDRTQTVFLRALASAIRGEGLESSAADQVDWYALLRLAQKHNVLPMVVQTLWDNPDLRKNKEIVQSFYNQVKRTTIRQACMTGEFLLLYKTLQDRGLQPAVLKGFVCRSLYPHPEQRPSVDEDMLVDPSEFPAIHQAMLENGLTLADDVDVDSAHEVAYEDKDRHLYIEIHKQLFDPVSEAVSRMNDAFAGALERAVNINVYGVVIRTLHPTDHLLYMLCHAYKHLVYSGFGIRQICDICLFARRYDDEIDWDRITALCRQYRIYTLAAAVFRIGSAHLDIPEPVSFADCMADELPLLEDVLTGGLYGTSDDNRLHSSNITLGAVEADRKGKRSSGLWRSVFPPREYLTGRYPYAKRHPALLPAAWCQRLYGYLTDKKSGRKNKPAESIRIAARRIELLRKYDIID